MTNWSNLKKFNDEEFSVVPDCGSKYLISNYGRVFSLFYKKPKEMSPVLINGYPAIKLITKTKRKQFLVHRLVSSGFVKKKDGKNEVNHIDGNKRNNHFSNLEWVTRSENIQHAYDNGLSTRVGEKNSRSIITEKIAIKIKEMLNSGNTVSAVASHFNLKYHIVSDISRGRNWKHI